MTMMEVWDSLCSVDEDASHLQCDPLKIGKLFWPFREDCCINHRKHKWMSQPLLWGKMHLMVSSCYKTVIGTDRFSKCRWRVSCYFVVHCIFFTSFCVPWPVLWLWRSHRLAVNGDWSAIYSYFIYISQVLWFWFQSVLYFSAWINDSVASIGSQLSHVRFHWYVNRRIIRWLMHSSNSHQLETCIPWLLNTEVILWSLSFLTKYTVTIGKSVHAHGIFQNLSGCKTFCVNTITWPSTWGIYCNQCLKDPEFH